MIRIYALVLSFSVLLSSCYSSGNRQSDAQADDGSQDPATEVVTDGPDSSEAVPDPTGDSAGDFDVYDMDSSEFDGYWPPTCGLFAVNVEWDVQYEEPYVSQALFEASDEPMLSVIALYQAMGCADETRCPVTVQVSRTYRPVVLLLTSHEPIEWVIQRAEGARINKILVFSMYESTVSGADDVPTDLRDDEYVGHCWPRCGGSDTESQVRAIAEDLGLELGSFHGAYEAFALGLWHICREECMDEVACAGRECGLNECGYECGTCPAAHVCVGHDCMACTADCTGRECGSDGCDGSCGTCSEDFVCIDGRCSEAPYYTGCDDISAESHYCITITEEGPALLGMDSGLVCSLGKGSEVFTDHMMYAHSIALLDGHLFMCVDETIGHLGAHGVLRFSMLSGLWEIIPVLCYAVTRYQDGVLIQPDMGFGPLGVEYYPSLEDLRDGNSVPLGNFIEAMQMTAHEHTLYGTDLSSDHVNRYQLLSGSDMGIIDLENYDTWIQGMAVTDDGLLMCNASWTERRVAVFDEATGDELYDVVPVNEDGESVRITGLVCFTNP